MIHFADLYPDELLFSAWVRTADQMQYPNRSTYFADVSGHAKLKPIIDLPCHLDHFVAALPDPQRYPVDGLIQAHTLYPYYQPFLPAERAQRLHAAMRSGLGQRLYWTTNLMNSPIPRRGWFRFCPRCVVEDRAAYGELDQVVGHVWTPEHLHRIFFTRRFARWLDKLGYLRFRQWQLYGEEGLAKRQAMIWLYGQTLTLEYGNVPLTQFLVSFQGDKKRFKAVKLLQRFETQYRSPQLSLWSEEEVKWLLARRLPDRDETVSTAAR